MNALLLLLLRPARAGIYSFLPMIDTVETEIRDIEKDNVQIYNITGAMLWGGTNGFEDRLHIDDLGAWHFHAAGDPRMISDLGLSLTTLRDQSMCSESDLDPHAACRAEVESKGDYKLVTSIDALADEAMPFGFFVALSGREVASVPYSMRSPTSDMRALVEYIEQQDYQVLHAEWELLTGQWRSMIIMEVPVQNFSTRSCIIAAKVNDSQVRKLRMEVLDYSGDIMGVDKDAPMTAVAFEPWTNYGRYYVLLEVEKYRNDFQYTFASTVLACKSTEP